MALGVEITPMIASSSQPLHPAGDGPPDPPVLSFPRPADLGEAALPIEQFYTRYKEPELVAASRAKETLGEYRRHVRRWQLWAGKYRTQYPVLGIGLISRADLADWRTWLMSPEGGSCSARTANKHLTSVQSILASAPLAAAPKLRPLPVVVAAKKFYLTYDQIDALYRACDVAAWPTLLGDKPLPYSPPRYWRAMLVMQFNYGPRTQELAAYEREQDTLTWGQVSWEPETPDQAGTAQNEHGWFWYTPQKQKRVKGDPLVLPLSQAAARHLRSIYPPGQVADSDRVFPFPYSPDSFYETWWAIVAASGVQLKKDLKTGERPAVELKLLRKTCETWHDTHSPGIGEIITGHAERTVSGKHYANRELRLVEAVNNLPQPASFHLPEPDPQLTLF